MPDAEFCYVTTVGRRTGRPHTVEIWYAREGDTVYVISERAERADWVRNAVAHPVVGVRLGNESWTATARLVSGAEEKERAGRLVAARYQGWLEGESLPTWLAGALPVALEPTARDAPDDGEGRDR